uniref:EKC/KEOPS complex subunit GON7 n=1 Tax=Blastobotrys adeninivorans TaxID=409370 RepID=A0A060TEU4_BLAAD
MSVQATYTGPSTENRFSGSDAETQYDAIAARQTDRNAPQPPSTTSLGNLQRQIVTVQAQVNEFLTARMKDQGNNNSNNEAAEELEKKMLDGNDEEDDE